MATPYLDLRTLGSATFVGDGRLVVWTVAWVPHALLNGIPLFDANLFFPTARALAYTEHMFSVGLLATPVAAITHNPILTFSVLWLASFWTNAMAAHLLAFRLTGRHSAALLAGLIFGWSYFRVLHLAHLQLQWTAWMPLGLVLLDRWYRSPSPMRLWPAAVVALLQILTSWYLAVLTVVLYGLWLIWMMFWRPIKPVAPVLLQLLAASVVGAALVVPFIIPYLRVLTPGPLTEMAGGSGDLAAYVLPPSDTIIGSLLQPYEMFAGRWVWGEQTLFLGWMAIALALTGSVVVLRQSLSQPLPVGHAQRTFFVALTIVGFVLSLGPMGFPLAPFDLLMQLPGLALFRAPARFAVLVMLGVSVLAAIGAAHIADMLDWRRRRFVEAAFAVMVGLAMLVEWLPIGANVPRAEVKAMPAIYQALDTLPPGAIVSLPDYRLHPEWFRRADYLLYSAFHWRSIVNGYGRGEPPEYLSAVEQLSKFPSNTSADLAGALGVRYVVVHASELPSDAPVRAALASPRFRAISQVGSDYLFEVVAAPR